MTIPSLLELTDDQRAVIELPFHGPHVITGAPGAGKTVAALYRAWTLTAAGHGVTLLTQSNLLHQYLAQTAQDLTKAVNITTYHRWMRTFWKEHFDEIPPMGTEGEWSYHWSSVQGGCIRNSIRSASHLVVDEGQRLPVGFYELCHILNCDVTVFADENQPIRNEQSTVSEIGASLTSRNDPLVLRGNHRNSRVIAMLAAQFADGGPCDIPDPGNGGRPATVLRVPDLDSFLKEMARYFSAYPERTIGIICRTSHMLLEVHRRLLEIGMGRNTQAYAYADPHRNAMDFFGRRIRIVTTASMKGLEFDTVFVPDLDSYSEDPTSVEARLEFLVLCTRARKEIFFAHRGENEPAILSDVSGALLARSTN